jgi:hypothetical protein
MVKVKDLQALREVEECCYTSIDGLLSKLYGGQGKMMPR